MSLHSLLRRQLKRHLATEDVSGEPWRSLVAEVDAAYRGFDTDREMVERAMELSSAELLEASSELRAVLQAFPDLILHIDAAGVIVALRGTECGGPFARDRVLQKHLTEILPPAQVRPLKEAFHRALNQKAATRLDLRHVEAGRARDFEVRVAPLGVAGAILIVRDVTEARQADDLRVAKEAAEASNLAKSAFLANMSHELRTPLNAIIGYSEMLAEDADGPRAEEIVRDLGQITSAGRHLLHIVNSVLDVAKIEAGRVEVQVEPVEVASLVGDVVTSVVPLAAANENTLDMTIAPGLSVITTDATKVRQVLINLLGNACKFTHGGAIAVEVRASGDGDQREVLFAVHDTGIGIPEPKLATLFQDFMQVDESVTRRYGGTGLGLAISQRLCHLLGGRIEVSSQLGLGSTFTVRLPLDRPAEGGRDGRAAAAAAGGEDA
jgi:signal transduction histidine kinase